MAGADEQPMADELRRRLAVLDRERQALTERLARVAAVQPPASEWPPTPLKAGVGIHQRSPTPEKVALFRSLFAGRTDVVPVRWTTRDGQRSGYSPACANEWQPLVCAKPKIKCSECPHQAFLPVTDALIERHLRGEPRPGTREAEFVAGVYPLLPDDSCRLLALDFDNEGWREDAQAFMDVCRARGVPAALERSRSGDGGHVWIFFSEAVPARDARSLGAHLLTETLERRPELGLQSYDRCFPSQDMLPRGGFGNLIALPLQRQARDRGHSVFLDERLEPYADQWAFLAALPRMTPQTLRDQLLAADARGPGLPLRIPVDADDGEDPWLQPPSRRKALPAPTGPFPASVRLVLADEIYVDRTALTPSLVTRLLRVAAFQNPEFYQAQALRLSTYRIPRVISCGTVDTRFVALPRGCLAEVCEVLSGLGIMPLPEDRRESGSALDVRFVGTLREDQQRAFEALQPHDCGVLAATTAFGKTVLAIALLAARGRSALVLVHRRELLDQWRARLAQFLAIDPKAIGVIGGGKRAPSGRIDVAVLQSLVRHGEVSDLIDGYGQLIVDECHHLSAASFEQVARRSKARYVLGLSATVTRKDGHQPIIFMQCGPVRHRVRARDLSSSQQLAHRVRLRYTDFDLPATLRGERPSMPAVYAALAADAARNALIFDDVLTALQEGRCPVVLTERRDHLEQLRARFERFTRRLIVLRGGLSRAEREAARAALAAADEQERLVLATGRYLGEGFDDPRLDTLFLVLPIAWRGTLAQYVGRLHRARHGKSEVRVYDYVDAAVPVLARMAAKRRAGYRALGYEVEMPAQYGGAPKIGTWI